MPVIIFCIPMNIATDRHLQLDSNSARRDSFPSARATSRHLVGRRDDEGEIVFEFDQQQHQQSVGGLHCLVTRRQVLDPRTSCVVSSREWFLPVEVHRQSVFQLTLTYT